MINDYVDVQDEFNSTKRCRTQEPQNEPVGNFPNWVTLPYPATVKVLSYLSDKDRVAMSQVCCAWNNCYKNPILWRTREFTLKGEYDKADVYFTSIFGRCLQNVCLHIWYGLQRNLKSIVESVELVTENLKNARLHYFFLNVISFKRSRKFPQQLNTINTCIMKMLETQSELRGVDLKSCFFSQPIGTELLNILATSNGNELRYLNITNFIYRILNVNDLEIFRETLPKFSNLTYMSVNYSYISDDVLRQWAVSLRNKLKMMRIIVNNREPHYHIIQRGTWRELSSSCPDLKVTLVIINVSQFNEIISILKPSIPLTTFILMFRMVNAEASNLAATVKHLGDHFHQQLEYLRIQCEEMQGFVDEGLVDVLERCRRLQTFRFTGNFNVMVPNKIFDLLKDSQSVLCSCTVDFDPLDDSILDPDIVQKIELINSILPLKDDIDSPWEEDIFDLMLMDMLD